MKYEITSGIAATNTIPDVVYGDYDVVATPADGYTATANPAKLTVNAATASAKIITAETKTFTLTPSLDTYIKSDAADATHASDTVLLVNQSNPSSGATGGAAVT